MSLINELLQLNEKKTKAWGPKWPASGDLPQFAKERDTAEVLAGYAYDDETVFEVELIINKPADNEDAEAAAKEAGMSDRDRDTYTTAQYVSCFPEVRKILEKKGFDGFADYSVLENTQPMQYVVFDKSQVKYKIKESITEAKTTYHPWAKEMVKILKSIKTLDKKVIPGMGLSDGEWVEKKIVDEIKAEFKAQGFKIKTDPDGYYIVSKQKPTCGISVRKPEPDEKNDPDFKGRLGLFFYDEENW